jgi:hypothetical protein
MPLSPDRILQAQGIANQSVDNGMKHGVCRRILSFSPDRHSQEHGQQHNHGHMMGGFANLEQFLIQRLS